MVTNASGVDIRKEPYKLPTDVKEMDRLGVQHAIWSLMIGGLFPVAVTDQVNQLLEPAEERRPTVLDVGCGSAIWSISMAKEFPDAGFIALDLNAQKFSDAPGNFKFVQGDLALALPQFGGQADIIHCRCVAQHVKDPQGLLRMLADCLRPGGLLLLADGDWVVYDQSKKLVEPLKWWESTTTNTDSPEALEVDASGRSWYAGWLTFFGNLTRSKDYRPIQELVNNVEALKTIDSHRYLSPINWPGEGIENGKALGEVLYINQRNFFKGAKEVALRTGLSKEMIDIWERHYDEEIDHAHYYNVWHYLTAQKHSDARL